MKILDTTANRCVRPVQCLNLEPVVLIRMYMLVIKRWRKNNNDNFRMLKPQGINVEVSNGDVVIEKRLITEFSGLENSLYVIVDDLQNKLAARRILKGDSSKCSNFS